MILHMDNLGLHTKKGDCEAVISTFLVSYVEHILKGVSEVVSVEWSAPVSICNIVAYIHPYAP